MSMNRGPRAANRLQGGEKGNWRVRRNYRSSLGENLCASAHIRIYDSFGGFKTPKAFFKRLTDGGIEVPEFNPINPLKLKKQWLVNNRDHRKLLVVDGQTAFIGGIKISSVYSSGSAARRGDLGDR